MGLKIKLTICSAVIISVMNCAYYMKYRYHDNCCKTRSSIEQSSHLPETRSKVQCSDSGAHTEHRSIAATLDPFKSRLQYYQSQIFFSSQKRDGKLGKCTLIMLTYKRIKALPQILNVYCNIAELDKILVIWNNIGSKIPQSILDISKSCTVELVFIIPKENKMSNRFQPRKEIETECVTVIDDDLIFDVIDIKFGIRSWQKFKHLLLGFTDRTRGYTLLKDGTYRYSLGGAPEHLISPQHKTGYSIIIPPLFFHRAYLEMLFDPVMIPSELVTYIDKIMNCDDILMSIVVSKFMRDCDWPQSGALQLKHKKDIHDVQGIGKFPCIMHESMAVYSIGGGLASRKKHPETRTECLSKFTKAFGYLPLVPEDVTLIDGG